MDNPREKQLRVLVLEDDNSLAEDMCSALESAFKKRTTPHEYAEYQLRIDVIAYSQALAGKLKERHYHFLSLDLRVPIVPGAPLGSEPVGFDEYEAFVEDAHMGAYKPICPGAVLTQYGAFHVGTAQRAGRSGLEFWGKSAADVSADADPPRLDPELWAEFVLERLLPYSTAMHHVLHLLSPLLPRALARLCDQLLPYCVSVKQLKKIKSIQNAREENRDALLAAFRLGELCKEWLFSLTAAHLNMLNALPSEVSDFAKGAGEIKSAVDIQALKEQYLETMLLRMVELHRQGNVKEPAYTYGRFFSHLDVVPEAENKYLEFVNGLKILRKTRNKLAHQDLKPPYEQLWQEISIPLRRVLDALALLGSFPLVTQVRAVAPGYVQASRFDAVNTMAQTFPVERIGTLDARSPDAHFDPRQVYALWPTPSGGLGLVPLWPWVALLRPNHEPELVTYLYAGRNPKGFPLGLECDHWTVQTFAGGETATDWRSGLEGARGG